jgi:predicted site-specific integrase-resolvase
MPRTPRILNPQRPILLISIPTAAALLDVSAATLYRWISEGQFKYIELPSGVMKISLEHIAAITGYSIEYLVQVVRGM